MKDVKELDAIWGGHCDGLSGAKEVGCEVAYHVVKAVRDIWNDIFGD